MDASKTVYVDSTRTLPYYWQTSADTHKALTGLLTATRAVAVSWWINRGSYTYAFFNANKVSRALQLVSYLRERGIRYQVIRHPSEVDNVAVSFLL